jgi:hypothetical protein
MVSQRLRGRFGMTLLAASIGAATGCGDVNAALEKVSEAQRLAFGPAQQATDAFRDAPP